MLSHPARYGCRALVAAAILGSLVASAQARVWYVNIAASQPPFDGSSFAHGFTTIQDAISAAADKDEIRVARGVYPQNFHVREELYFYGGYAGTDDTTRNPAATPTILDGGGSAPVITCAVGSSVHFDGFTIQHGEGVKTGGVTGGGGIVADGSYCAVSNCIFKDNHVAPFDGFGGAIANIGVGQLFVFACTFTNNTADSGGAVAALSGAFAVYIEDSTFDHNGQASATAPKGRLGGAVYVEGVQYRGDMVRNTFSNNTASFGGAVYLFHANDQAIAQNLFTGNSAGPIGSGGALVNDTGDRIIITRNTFSANMAQSYGGAIYSDTPGASSVSISSNVVSGNYAGATTFTGISGGGMVVGGAYVVNNTIVGQQHGAGISISSPGYTANNIVAFNPAGITRDSAVVTGPLHANDVFGNTGANYANINDPTGADGNIQQDPLFVDRDGGDFHLLGASPCINAGNTSDAASFAGTLDIDVQPRVNGPSVDIGADEFYPALVFTTQPGNGRPGQPLAPQPAVAFQDRGGNALTQTNGTVTVTLAPASGASLGGTKSVSTSGGAASFSDLSVDRTGTGYTLVASVAGIGTEGGISAPFSVLFQRGFVKPTGNDALDGGSWEKARKTIPAAFNVTGGPDGEVWVAAGTYDGPITVPSGLTVIGGFEGTETRRDQRLPGRKSTIDAHDAGPCVRFISTSDNGIDGFRLTGGTGQLVNDLSLPQHREGGGVYMSSASPVVSNNLIISNAATLGGGIYTRGGHPTIVGNVITQNGVLALTGLAGAGGGILMASGTLANNVIFDNIAAGGTGPATSFGGAMVISGSLDVHNNTFVGNRSPLNQADIYIVQGSPRFTNNIINNVAAIGKETRSTPVFSHNDYVAGKPVTNQIASPNGTDGNIGTSPVFVSRASDNYHLPADSFLKDAGDISVIDRGERDMDIEPRVMGAGVDIGADEVTVPDDGADLSLALAICGGMQTASVTDALRLDIVDPPGIEALDAVAIARKLAGLDPNP